MTEAWQRQKTFIDATSILRVFMCLAVPQFTSLNMPKQKVQPPGINVWNFLFEQGCLDSLKAFEDKIERTEIKPWGEAGMGHSPGLAQPSDNPRVQDSRKVENTKNCSDLRIFLAFARAILPRIGHAAMARCTRELLTDSASMQRHACKCKGSPQLSLLFSG